MVVGRDGEKTAAVAAATESSPRLARREGE